MAEQVTTEVEHAEQLSFWHKYIFSTDHKTIGKQYMFLALFMAVVGAFAKAYSVGFLITGISHMLHPRLWADFFTELKKKDTAAFTIGVLTQPIGLLIVIPILEIVITMAQTCFAFSGIFAILMVICLAINLIRTV